MPNIINGLGQTKVGVRNAVAPSYSYLIDSLTSSVSFSMYKLKSTYSGFCLRVRRSSDNTSQDIGFVNNYIDMTSLLSFVGNGNGFISIWYDQSGNGNNFTQNTLANQPQIVSSGIPYTVNGNLVWRGSVTKFLLLTSAVALTLTSDPYNAAWWLSYSKDTQGTQPLLISNNSNYIFGDYGTTQLLGNNSYNITVTQYSTNTLRLMNGVYNRTGTTKSATLYANNVSLGTNTNTVNIAAFGSTQYLPYNQFATGNFLFNEFVLLQSNTTIDRSTINSNISNRILVGQPTTTAYDTLTNYYSGDSTLNDKKGSSNGTIVGSVTYAAGINNNAFSFSGTSNNYISFPTDFYEPSGSFTSNFWVKTNSASTVQTIYTSVASNGFLGFRVFLNAGAVVFRTFPIGVTYNELTTTTGQYVANSWYMITAVNDVSNGMRIYINGILIASNTITQAISWGTTSLNRLGGNYDGNTCFNGLIDEAALFNSALSGYQVDELYKNGVGKFY